MIIERRMSEKIERFDLLAGLLEANTGVDEQDIDSAGITEREVMGNIYMFLLAGHEVCIIFSFPLDFLTSYMFNLRQQTTAHTLCFAFALLALYEDEQDKLFTQLQQVLPDRRNPVRFLMRDV